MDTEFTDSLLVTLRLYGECFCELHSAMKELQTSDWLMAALVVCVSVEQEGNAVSKR